MGRGGGLFFKLGGIGFDGGFFEKNCEMGEGVALRYSSRFGT